ncbi:MAG: helix-turn-helix transcriptional regulator [Rhodopseudomonas palustris]|nr:helix-turn-helix transcriptional regulator [Rhodopseudomonas palustris]
MEHIPDLTPAEIRVFVLVGQGLSNREIAEEMFRDETTIRTHLKRCYSKLVLKGRGRLAVASSRLINHFSEGA